MKTVDISFFPDNKELIVKGLKTSTLRSDLQARKIKLLTNEYGIMRINNHIFLVKNHGLKKVEDLGGRETVWKSEGFEHTSGPKFEQTKEFLAGAIPLYYYTFTPAKFFAGIGSRETPPEILILMTKITQAFRGLGYILRSGGGAKGADSAFEKGAGPLKDIYLASDSTPESFKLAEKHHPGWKYCSEYARKLHARNGQILLGRDLDIPVEFVICWTKNGKDLGGTAQALRIARDRGIKIYNLAFQEHYLDLREYFKFLKYSLDK